MDKKTAWSLCLLLFSLLVFSGCGEGPLETTDDSTKDRNDRLSDDEHPARTVATEFLAGMLRGDKKRVRSLLTPLARKRGEEKGVPFSPEASDTATFTWDKTVPKGKIGAYVHTTLTDLDERGQKESVEIVWIVAKSEEGWRIAGAAIALFEGQEKTVINFEDPDAALQAIADAEEREIKRRKESEHIRQVQFTTNVYR